MVFHIFIQISIENSVSKEWSHKKDARLIWVNVCFLVLTCLIILCSWHSKMVFIYRFTGTGNLSSRCIKEENETASGRI